MLVLLKIGGGSISPKNTYGKFIREDSIRNLARVIRKLLRENYKFVIVHGGGGHAHTPVRCYGILRCINYDNRIGISITKLMLCKLKIELLKVLIQEGVPAYPIETYDVLTENGVNIDKVANVLRSGFVPVLNGEIVPTNDSVRIVSGDDLLLYLARDLRPDLCLFLIDKPGIVNARGDTLPVLKRGAAVEFLSVEGIVDVTGGIVHKLSICERLCEYVKHVYICSVDCFESVEYVIRNRGETVPCCTRILCTE